MLDAVFQLLLYEYVHHLHHLTVAIPDYEVGQIRCSLLPWPELHLDALQISPVGVYLVVTELAALLLPIKSDHATDLLRSVGEG